MVYKLLIMMTLLVGNEGKRILGFFPLEGKSQHNIFAAILYGLAKQGHEVVYLTPVKPDLTHPNLDVRLKPSYIELYRETWKACTNVPPFLSNFLIYDGLDALHEHCYGDAVTQSIIHSNETFDAVLMESYLSQEPVSALMHKFGCVAIEVSTLPESSWLNELSGLPDNPAYLIDWTTPLTDSMTFTERLYNSYLTFLTVMPGYYHLWKMQSVTDKYFNYTGWESRPPLSALVSNRSLILISKDVALDYPYPRAPHVKEIGAVHVLPNKPLPKELQDFMDNAEEGVIYFSMGSNLNTSEIMKSYVGKSFIPVFKGLKQKVLMKWESNHKIKLPSNIHTYKWVPQHSVLAHKNCVLFITHGGLLSLTEAVYYGVPVVGIPHFADQPKNMMHVQKHGYGLQLTLDNITQASASWAIHEVLNNPRYKEEITRRSKLLRDKKHSAIDEAVFWVEYAIKYPNVLTPKGAFLNFFQLHMIDITLFWLLFIFITYKSIVKSLSIVANIIFKREKEKFH